MFGACLMHVCCMRSAYVSHALCSVLHECFMMVICELDVFYMCVVYTVRVLCMRLCVLLVALCRSCAWSLQFCVMCVVCVRCVFSNTDQWGLCFVCFYVLYICRCQSLLFAAVSRLFYAFHGCFKVVHYLSMCVSVSMHVTTCVIVFIVCLTCLFRFNVPNAYKDQT